MTRVTTDGLEMRDRCPASTSVMRAPARLAINVWFATGMTWSAVPITAQDGMVFQAGGPNVAASALAASGRWVVAMTAAWLAGRPLAKHPGTRLGLRYRSKSPGTPGMGTMLNTWAGLPATQDPLIRLATVSP